MLRGLIQLSALPLRDLEVDFAQDASGFASTAYHRWFDHKWGGSKKETKWVKVHLMCGVQTNIVTVADAAAGQSADSPYLPDFVRITAEHFRINEVLMKVLCHNICVLIRAMYALGITPVFDQTFASSAVSDAKVPAS